jgi:hypothetical protein
MQLPRDKIVIDCKIEDKRTWKVLEASQKVLEDSQSVVENSVVA